MRVASYLIGCFLGLPRQSDKRKIVVERDLKIPAYDGAVLLADRYYPAGGEDSPLILVRSFYGRSGFFGLVWGRMLAEQGFQVVIQSCRGTFGSEGEFLPLLTEKDDGLATVEWLKEQDWYPGSFATTGPSYLGYVQWAIAAGAGADLKAMAPQITASNFRGMGFPGDSFALNTTLSWMYIIEVQESYLKSFLALLAMRRKFRRSFKHLPLGDLDKLTLGKQVDFWQLLLVMGESREGEFTVADFSETVPDVSAPVSMQGGWYDIFLPWMLKDFTALQEAGRKPHIIIGPWTHINVEGGAAGLKDSVNWLRAHLLDDPSGLREAPVKLYVMGANEWRMYQEWPPPGSNPVRWHLQAQAGLAPDTPDESEPDCYRYDPANPTPAVGGAVLFEIKGSKNNRTLEKRPDVLTYTSEPLQDDMEIIGPVKAELFVCSSLEDADYFVRLCDVYPSGKSINICDGLQRIRRGHPPSEPDGSTRVGIELWPTAYCFRRGHRVRLQVSGGAHPRFARNPGSGEPLASAADLYPSHQEIYHDPARPSAVILPVMERQEPSGADDGRAVIIVKRCIWCNREDDTGRLKEITVTAPKRPAAATDKPPLQKEKIPVHPEHEQQARRYISGVNQFGKWLVFGLVLNLLLSSIGLVTLLAAGWLAPDAELWAGIIYIGPPLIVISLLLLAFPYAATPVTILSMGIKRATLIIRILATGMLILGAWFLTHL